MAFVVFVGFVFRSIHRAPFAGRRTRAMLDAPLVQNAAIMDAANDLLTVGRAEFAALRGE
jgi:hypothetical protein